MVFNDYIDEYLGSILIFSKLGGVILGSVRSKIREWVEVFV